MLQYLLWFAFLLGQLGLVELLRGRGVPVCFAPLVSICAQVTLIYAAGFAGGLLAAEWALTAVGCACLIARARKADWAAYAISPGWWLFVAGCAVAYFACRGRALSHWDDFSHWGRVCKAFANAGGFPTFETARDVGYSTYPPGMAIWCTYLSNLLRPARPEGLWLWGKAVLSFACLSCLFAPLRVNRRGGAAIAVMVCVSALLLSIGYESYNLLADTTLGLLAAAAVMIVLGTGTAAGAPGWTPLPVVCVLALTKNSGLLFVLFVGAFALRFGARPPRSARARVGALGAALAPFALWGGWQIISRIYFPRMLNRAQAFSPSRFLDVFRQKEAAVVAQVAKGFGLRLLTFSDPYIALFWATIALGCAGAWYFAKRPPATGENEQAQKPNFAGVLGTLAACAGVYLLFLLLTYLCALDQTEALTLVAFYRYFGSLLVMMIGVLCGALALRLASLPKPGRSRALWWVIVPCLGFLVWTRALPALNPWQAWHIEGYSQDVSQRLQAALADIDSSPSSARLREALWIVDDTGEQPGSWQTNELYCTLLLSYSLRERCDGFLVQYVSEYEPGELNERFQNRTDAIAIITDGGEQSRAIARELGLRTLSAAGR